MQVGFRSKAMVDLDLISGKMKNLFSQLSEAMDLPLGREFERIEREKHARIVQTKGLFVSNSMLIYSTFS